ncbi:SDR family NAD(P)-dependent oxidoreductase [Prosthecodimorpha staleyi]|uniref:SDR family oxidoreductase n=1 Tax=Prosthecodimorpha staleyi TaxID=2840188 RepID=A0A947DBG5_9HYPH|nr:SDR family oxidoreductase [Prosthecodimorpha staleyi]MBT9291209.1 SDR family oxidoreductase [Prosthecodimorpha staleyi]
MSGRLRHKVAIVMGAGSSGPGWGNGKATSVLFAREGAKVVAVDRNLAAAEETAEIIRLEGGDAVAVACDATREAEIVAAIETAKARFGRIDILDNNIGIAEVGGVVEVAEAEWDRVFDVNLKSAYLAMKHVIPLMVAQGGGAIVNITSIAGLRYTGVPYCTYSATKAALGHLTRTTAAEYAARKVRVNAIAPGLMKTPMVEHTAGLAKAYGGGDIEAMWKKRDDQVPMGHMGDAWDVAYAAVYLVSDEAKYVTGVELVVDGGITLKYS